LPVNPQKRVNLSIMNLPIQHHSLWKSILLHLLPGALITLLYFISGPFLIKAGFPVLMPILLAILLVLVPFELGYLFIQGKKQNGQFSLNNIVLNREPIPVWQYFVFVPLLICWCGLFFVTLGPLDSYLIQHFFSWLPTWSIVSQSAEILAQYPSSVLWTTVIAGFVLNGFAGPIVEELYFRGYLLPRIPVSTTWAPLINVLLFSLYHFFSPWQNITRILALIPMVYVVSRKKNIYLGIITHCSVNIIGMLPLLALLASH